MKFLKYKRKLSVFILMIFLLCPLFEIKAAKQDEDADKRVLSQYREYQDRLSAVGKRSDISENGFEIVENQIFTLRIHTYGDVVMIPAFDRNYHRLVLFFEDAAGQIVYRTDQLEVNNRLLGQMEQPGRDIAAVSFRDLNQDGRMDIILIVSCVNKSGDYARIPYKVGDVLFADGQNGFYRDYRISEKINRFGMNKGAEVITSFVRDGYSTEFLYTAPTLNELLKQGFTIIENQSYERTFEKLGKLKVVPGIYRISNYDIFMIYLVNEQGGIVSSLQPMEDYESLYALRGINCRDIDGDGLKDIAILARYSCEDENGESFVASGYSIYYQRTGGFSADTYVKSKYRCSDDDSMESLIEKARAYWGWKSEG